MSGFITFLAQASIIFWVIMLLSVVMWWTIGRSYLKCYWLYPAMKAHYQQEWLKWQGQSHRIALAIRDGYLSEVRSRLSRQLVFIRTLTGVLPLMGLLGTVDGMIDNFSVLSDGLGVSALFSQGIAQALLTTLAGLVTGLSGLYFCHSLNKKADMLTLDLAQHLVVEGQ